MPPTELFDEDENHYMPEILYLSDSLLEVTQSDESESTTLFTDPSVVFEEYLKNLQARALQLNFIRPASGYKGL